jgi:hypothetical protein
LRALTLGCALCAAPALAESKAAPPRAPIAIAAEKRPQIEVAFVLDTTSSMSGLIEGAKQKIWTIASSMARGQPTPHIKVGLVAYRDVGDAYVTQRLDLTDDLDAVFAKLTTLRAEGGGDTPEHVGKGLGEAVSKLSWGQSPKTMKMIFLVGDAPPQNHRDGWDANVWAKRAIEKNIIVNTVRCGADMQTEAAWKEIARIADGSYISIRQDGGMLATATPYDAKIAGLNAELGRKTLYGGGSVARRESEKRAKELEAMPAEAAADRASYGMRSAEAKGKGAAMMAPAAVAGSVDLVAAPAAAMTMKAEELPDELKAMKPEQRVEHAKKLAAERQKLEGELAGLAKQRDEWLSKNAPAKKDSFDEKVMNEVRARAEKHGVKY